ncbi:hypothetical protein GR28A_00069 [Vibrio phage vB_VcorM_GR28A]|nr:hypothetical protein GR28A_00069 [Vibrio phage vB_VcorM_GR28A]
MSRELYERWNVMDIELSEEENKVAEAYYRKNVARHQIQQKLLLATNPNDESDSVMIDIHTTDYADENASVTASNMEVLDAVMYGRSNERGVMMGRRQGSIIGVAKAFEAAGYVVKGYDMNKRVEDRDGTV